MKELSLFICENLNYTIGYKKIFRNLSFSVSESELWLLTGENGAGKSTLLKLLYENKQNSFRFSKKFPVPFSYLGHETGLYSSLSLKENLDFYKSIFQTRISDEKIQFLLEAFRLQRRLLDPVHTFSEGMKKKSGLIRALLPEAPILLLDEPFNGLDTDSTRLLKDILREYKKNNSLIVAIHDTSILKEISTGEMRLRDNQLEFLHVASTS